MPATRRFASLVALALAAVMLASCADDHSPVPSAPVAPDPLLIGDVTQIVDGTIGGVGSSLSRVVSGLVECNVRTTSTASQTIGPRGGVLRVGRHQLYVPPGALLGDVHITATAPAGKHVEVRFEPHGLEFARPTALTMSYADCGVLKPLGLRIVYVDENLDILEVLLSLPNPFNRTVTGKVEHFSRYMLAD
jgi:hypothetical protein